MLTAIQHYSLNTNKQISFSSDKNAGNKLGLASVILTGACLSTLGDNILTAALQETSPIEDAFAAYSSHTTNYALAQLYPEKGPKLKISGNDTLQIVSNDKEVLKEVKIKNFKKNDTGYQCLLKGKGIDVKVDYLCSGRGNETIIKGVINGTESDYRIKQDKNNDNMEIINNKTQKVVAAGVNPMKVLWAEHKTLAVLGIFELIAAFGLSIYLGHLVTNKLFLDFTEVKGNI